MVYDANLTLHGKGSGGALVDLDESDAVAILTSVNADGNKVLDLRKTGAKGLIASLILIEEADSLAYDDEAVITIEESDFLDRNWQTVVTFPTLHAHLRRIYVTCTVGFDAADIGAALTSQAGHTGQLLKFDQALATAAGSGYLYVEMDDAGDTFADVVGQNMDGTTGRSTVTRTVESHLAIQMQPKTYHRRFTSDKRYIRCNASNVEDSIGLVWILLTNDAGGSPSVI